MSPKIVALVTVPCFCESTSTRTAYVRVAKAIDIAEATKNFVMGRAEGF